MATFSIREIEGMRQIKVDLEADSFRARRGALSNMMGAIEMIPRLPGPLEFVRSLYNDEARIRPEYRGTGSVLLQPTMAGYHLMDLDGESRWILEPGVYWASAGTIRLGLARDPVWTSFFLGDGFLNWKTAISGTGRVVLRTPGPVQEVEVNDSVFRAQGRIILGRTAGLKFGSALPARWPRSMWSGQERLRKLSGTGKVLVCFTPYWRSFLYQQATGTDVERSLLE